MNQQLMDVYAKTYGKRFTILQKKKCAEQLKKDMSERGYACEELKKRKGLSHCRSYFFGDKANVKTIVAVPFDTPERKFWYKTQYYPMDGTLSNKKNSFPTYAPIMIAYVLVFILLSVFGEHLKGTSYADLASTGVLLFILLMAYMLLQGFGNKQNYNRNTAAFVTALELAEALNKDERREIGFLFLDANRGNYLGADSSSKIIEEEWHKSVEVIFLNCIGVGEDMVVGYNAANRKRAEEIIKYTDLEKKPVLQKLSDEMRAFSVMFFFKRAVVISSGTLDEDGNLKVEKTGTGKDITVEETRVDEIRKMVLGFLKARVAVRGKH